MSLPGYDTTTGEVFADLWLSSSWQDEQVLAKLMLAKVDKNRAQKPDFLGRLKTLPAVDHVKPRWLEQEGYVHKLTGTFSSSGTTFTVTGDLFGQSITRALLLRVARPNSILAYTEAGLDYRLLVSAVHGSNPVLTCELYGGATAIAGLDSLGPSSNGTGIEVRVIGEPYTDAEDATNPRMVDRKTRYTTTQIFSDTLQMLKTRAKQRMEGNINELETQVDELLWKLRIEKAYSVIQMYPKIVSSAAASMIETERPTLCGLEWSIQNIHGTAGERPNASIWKSAAGARLDAALIDGVAKAMGANGTDFDNGDWLIWVHPNQREWMHDFGLSYREVGETSTTAGFYVDRIRLKNGKVMEIADDWYMPEDKLFILNMNDWGIGNIADDSVSREELPHGGRYRKWQISEQVYGLVNRNALINGGGLFYLATS
jgi:hypothetical protein